MNTQLGLHTMTIIAHYLVAIAAFAARYGCEVKA